MTGSDLLADVRATIIKSVTAALAPTRESLDQLQQSYARTSADIAARTEVLKARNAAAAAEPTPTAAAMPITAPAATPAAATPAIAPAVVTKRLDEMTPAEQKAAAVAALPNANEASARLAESLVKAAQPQPRATEQSQPQVQPPTPQYGTDKHGGRVLLNVDEMRRGV